MPHKLCSFGLVLPASANWFHCVPFSKDTGRAVTFLVLNSIWERLRYLMRIKDFIHSSEIHFLVGGYPSGNYCYMTATINLITENSKLVEGLIKYLIY